MFGFLSASQALSGKAALAPLISLLVRFIGISAIVCLAPWANAGTVAVPIVPMATLSTPPEIYTISPTTAATGQQVVITGFYFTNITAVRFGGVPASSFTVNSFTEIVATVGAGASGNVQVVGDDGTGSLPGFIYCATPAPTISASGSTNLCLGETVTLTASGASSYLWSNGQSGTSIVVREAGVYTAQNTGAGCPSGPSNAITVSVGRRPGTTHNLGSGIVSHYEFSQNLNDVSAQNNAAVLTGTAAYTSLPSKHGGANFGIQLNGATDQYVTIPDKPGRAPVNNSFSVSMHLRPNQASYNAGYMLLYQNDFLQAYSAATVHSFALFTTAGVYYCFVNNPAPTATDLHLVTVVDGVAKTFSLYQEGVLIERVPFLGDLPTATGDAYVGKNYGFNAGFHGVLDQLVEANRALQLAEVAYLHDHGQLAVATSNSPLNVGQTLQLTAPFFVNATYSWMGPNGFASILQNPEITNVGPVNVGTYQLVITDGPCSTTPLSTTVALDNAAPTITGFTPAVASTGETVTITGTNFTGATAVQFGGVAASSFVVNSATSISAVVGAGASGSVAVTTAGGAVSRAGFTYCNLTRPTITASGSTALCPGGQVLLTASGSSGLYRWSTGDVATSIWVSAVTMTLPVTITVRAEDGLCTSAPSMPVVVTTSSPAPKPTVTITGSTSLCNGSTVALTGPAGYEHYAWTNGETTQSITVSTAATLYLQVATSNGCFSEYSDAVVVTDVTPYTPHITYTNLGACQGDTIYLQAPAGYAAYDWQGSTSGITTQRVLKVVASAAIIRVRVQEYGCWSALSEGVATVFSARPAKPIITNVAGTTILCPGGSIILEAPTAMSYLWSDGSAGQSLEVVSAGKYAVQVLNGACASLTSDTIVITSAPVLNTLSITPSGLSSICDGDSVLLTASASSAGYRWSNGATTQSIWAKVAGNYSVQAASGTCLGQISNFVELELKPLSTLFSPPDGLDSLCQNTPLVVSYAASPGIAYLWDGASTGNIYSISTAGSHYVQQVVNGCPGPKYFFMVHPRPARPAVTRPTISNPVNNTTNISFEDFLLSWTPQAQAREYRIYLYPSSEPRPATPFAVVGSSTLNYQLAYNHGLPAGVILKAEVMAWEPCSQEISAAVLFSFGQRPDLRVTNLVYAPTLNANSNASLTYTVTNMGSGSTGSKGWHETIYLNPDRADLRPANLGSSMFKLLDIANLKALAPGENYTRTVNIHIPEEAAANFYFWVMANRREASCKGVINADTCADDYLGDPTDGLIEADYPAMRNNVAHGQVFVVPQPRAALQPQALNGLPAQAFAGASLGLRYTVKNIGAFQAYGRAFVNYEAGSVSSNAGGSIITVPVLCQSRYWTDAIYLSKTAFFHPDSVTTLAEKQVHPRNLKGGLFPPSCYSSISPLVPNPAYEESQYIFKDSSYSLPVSVQLPNNITGSYYIYVHANQDGSVLTNPAVVPIQRFGPFQVLINPYADLTINSISVADTLASGQPATVGYAVRNQGFAATEFTTTDSIYFSRNATLSANRLAFGFHAFQPAGIGIGQVVNRLATVTLPDTAFGQYYVFVKLNSTKTVFEHTEYANNLAMRVGAVFIKHGPMPDLAIQQVFLPDSVERGALFQVNYRMVNLGPGVARSAYQDGGTLVSLADGQVYDLPPVDMNAVFTELAVGQSLNVRYNSYTPTTIPNGDYLIRLSLNHNRGINEAGRYANNVNQSGSLVRRIRIVEPGSILPDPNSQFDWQLLSASVQGQAMTRRSFLVNTNSLLDGPGLPANAAWLGFALANNAAGTGTLINLSGDQLSRIPALRSSLGHTSTLQLPNQVTAGNYWLVCTLINADATPESNTGNNRLVIPINIQETPAPDLVSVILSAPQTVVSGRKVKVVYRITNQGNAATDVDGAPVGNVTIRFLGLYSQGFSAVLDHVLQPGQSVVDSMEVIIPGWVRGAHLLTVIPNIQNYEADVDNNTSPAHAITFTEAPPADLVPIGLVTKPILRPGFADTLEVSIQNQGANPAIGNLSQYFDLRTPGQPDNQYGTTLTIYDTLAPGQTKTFRKRYTIPGAQERGDHSVFAEANASRDVLETDFANNTISQGPLQLNYALAEPNRVTKLEGVSGVHSNPWYFKITPPANTDVLVEMGMVQLTPGHVLDSIRHVTRMSIQAACAAQWPAGKTELSRITDDLQRADVTHTAIIPNATCGTYYFVASRQTFPGAALISGHLNVVVKYVPYSITSASPHVVGTGPVTFLVNGGRLEAGMVWKLETTGGAEVARAQSSTLRNSMQGTVKFNLGGVTPGQYRLVGINGANDRAAYATLITVEPATKDKFTVVPFAPAEIRKGRSGIYRISVTNDGNVDGEAVLVQVLAQIVHAKITEVKGLDANCRTIQSMNQPGVVEYPANQLILQDSVTIVPLLIRNLRPGATSSFEFKVITSPNYPDPAFFTRVQANNYSAWSHARHFYRNAEMAFRIMRSRSTGPDASMQIANDALRELVTVNPDKRKFIDTLLNLYYRGGILLDQDTVGHDPYDSFALGTDSASLMAPIRAAFPQNTKLLEGDPSNYSTALALVQNNDYIGLALGGQSGCFTCGTANQKSGNGSGAEQFCNTLWSSMTAMYAGIFDVFTEAAVARGLRQSFNGVVSLGEKLSNPAGLAQIGLGLLNSGVTRILEDSPVAQCWARGAFGTANSLVGMTGTAFSILADALAEAPTLGASTPLLIYNAGTLAKDFGLFMPILMTRLDLCEQLSRNRDSRQVQEELRRRGEKEIKTLSDWEGNIFGALLGQGLDADGMADCTPVVAPNDPNDIIGPAGYGPKRFVSTTTRHKYRIRFENDSTKASAAAQRILIRCKLPAKSLPGTLELGQLGFDNLDFNTVVGTNAVTTLLPVQGRPYTVQLTAGLDVANRQVIWEFQTLDPNTGEIPLSSALGMLPVNNATGVGEGYVDFSILADNLAQTGDSLPMQAEIFFDEEAAIITNRWINVLDAVAPTVNFPPIPALVNSPYSLRPLSASDDIGGSGLRNYRVWLAAEGSDEFEQMLDEYGANGFPVFSGSTGTSIKVAVSSVDNAGNATMPDFANAMTLRFTSTRALAFEQLEDTVKLCQGAVLAVGWSGLGVDTAVLALVNDAGIVRRVDTLLADSLSAVVLSADWPAGKYALRLMAYDDTTVSATAAFPLLLFSTPVASIDTLTTTSRCAEQAGLPLRLGGSSSSLSGITVRWVTPSELVISSDSIFATELGSYRLILTNALGCSDTASVLLTQKAKPSAPIIMGPATVCAQQAPTYSIAGLSAGTVVTWYQGANRQLVQSGQDTSVTLTLSAGLQQIRATVTQPGTCQSDTALLEVDVAALPALPVITFTGSTNLCLGDSVTLIGPAGMAAYLWSTGATTATIKVGTAGKFSIQVANQLGACFSPAADTVTVQVGPCVATWLGSISQDWHDARNWSPMRVPDVTDSAFIIATVQGPVVSQAVRIRSMQLGGGANVVLNANLTLQHLGGSGTIGGVGAVVLAGSGRSYVKGGVAFQNLELDNAAGATLLANCSYAGTLTMRQGVFDLNGRTLTAISNSAGTAELAPLAPGTGFANAGSFTFQRWLDPAFADANGAWMYVGSPVMGTTVGAFAQNNPFAANTYNYTRLTNSSFWFYDPTNNLYPSNLGYTKPTAATQSLLTGQGARVWFRRTPFYTQAISRLQLVGTPRTGNQVFEGLQYCGSNCPYTAIQGGAADNGWNLVANPYAATINWEAADWQRTNVANAVYIFRYSLGQFASYVGGVGVNGGSPLIAPGQAFFVQATGAGPSLVATEQVKASGGQMKTALDTGLVMRLRLQVGSQVSEVAYRHHSSATKGFDAAWDAYALQQSLGQQDSVASLRLVAGGAPYSILSQPAGLHFDTLRLDMAGIAAGSFSLHLSQVLPWLQRYQLTLLDQHTGQRWVIAQDQSFALQSRGTQDRDRYVIVLSPSPLSQANAQLQQYRLSPNPATGMVHFTAAVSGHWQLTLRDALGRPVRTYQATENCHLDLTGIPAGLYYLSVPGGRIRLVVE